MYKIGSSLGLGCLLACMAVQVGDEAPDYDERLKEALDAKGVKYSIDGDGDFNAVFKVGDDRTQIAILRSPTQRYGSFEIREIWSLGYRSETEDFPADLANELLEDTFRRKLGAWAKMKSGDVWYAVFVVKLSATAKPDAIWDALTLAVNTADSMEESLTGDQDKL